MDDAALLRALAPTAEKLLERHAGLAREWFPHELVDAATAAPPVDMADGYRRALVVNLLTEDNLPLYFAALLRALGSDGAWGRWVRRWTAEEMRHATVIRGYLTHAGAVDLRQLERDRFAHVLAARVPEPPTVADALAYLTLQERATRIAHANTGRGLPDPVGRTVMSTVAADENLHHLFYRDLVQAALDVSPSEVVIAIGRQVRGFTMPGTAIRGFADHARAIAAAGVYSTSIYVEQVVVPLVSRHWALDQREGLSGEAARARRRIAEFVARLRRLDGRLAGLSGESTPAAGARAGSS